MAQAAVSCDVFLVNGLSVTLGMALADAQKALMGAPATGLVPVRDASGRDALVNVRHVTHIVAAVKK